MAAPGGVSHRCPPVRSLARKAEARATQRRFAFEPRKASHWSNQGIETVCVPSASQADI